MMASILSTRHVLGRLFITLLAGAYLSIGLSGCGGSGSDQTAPEAAVTTPVADTPTTTTPVADFLTYKDPYHEKVAAAGYVQKSAAVNGVTLSYVEGPDNGPPLVLLHAQLLDWFSYSRVMPDLAQSFHVFVIDYQGHGATKNPSDYVMTANQIGADLADFIDKFIGQPVYISGNSSGGLLTTWLAANRPALVKAAVLEDPPLFSSEYPAIQITIADRTFKNSYSAATVDHPSDFLLYWIDNSAEFFANNFPAGTSTVLKVAIQAYRKANPGQPVELSMVTDDTVRMMLRGLDYQYDPRFGSAFYDGSWNAGFDHATALAKIEAPVLLMHANFSTLADGTLDGAMNQEQADHAMSLLKHGTYMRVDASHVVNLVAPDLYIKALKGFFLNQ